MRQKIIIFVLILQSRNWEDNMCHTHPSFELDMENFSYNHHFYFYCQINLLIKEISKKKFIN